MKEKREKNVETVFKSEMKKKKNGALHCQWNVLISIQVNIKYSSIYLHGSIIKKQRICQIKTLWSIGHILQFHDVQIVDVFFVLLFSFFATAIQAYVRYFVRTKCSYQPQTIVVLHNSTNELICDRFLNSIGSLQKFVIPFTWIWLCVCTIWR